MSETVNNSQANPKRNESIKSQIKSKISKKTKSKTVAKKSKNRNTNVKKRKLDECNTNTNNNINSIEPHSKRRKIDNNNISTKVNDLIELNESFQQQIHTLKQKNDQLTKQMDHYQEEAKKWKTQYMELYAKVNNTNDTKMLPVNKDIHMNHNEFDTNIISNKTNTLTPSPTPPPTKYFHKPKSKQTKATLNNIDDFESLQTDKTVPNTNISALNVDNNEDSFTVRKKHKQIDLISQSNCSIKLKKSSNGLEKENQINTNNNENSNNSTDNSNQTKNDYCKRLRSHSKMQKNKDTEYIPEVEESNFVEYEDSYYVSVHCHFCGEHFDAIYEFRDHLKAHFEEDPNKTWKQCDQGCTLKPMQDTHFIRHIAQHTGDRPYKCNIIVDGKQCQMSKGYKSEMKPHWRSHFKKKKKIKTQKYLKKPKTQKYVKKPKRILATNTINQQIAINNNINTKYTKFEDSYHFSVHCHMCKNPFNDFDKYRMHLENHYHTDQTKTWKKCDFGCQGIFDRPRNFVAHLSTHTGDRPFKCNVVTDGIKCIRTFGAKGNMKTHWQTHFDIGKNYSQLKKSKITYNAQYIKKNIHIGAQYVEFEKSYHISVNCHICDIHFDEYEDYRIHLQNHYEEDKDKIWKQCDLCDIKMLHKETVLFIQHLTTHTGNKPFKCDVIVQGTKCQASFGAKRYQLAHWYKHFKNYRASKLKKHKTYKTTHIKHKIKRKRIIKKRVAASKNIIEFENSYDISINCHLCNDHFDDLIQYRAHLKAHYDNDPNKTWLTCDLGCTSILKSHAWESFICHIASHTKDYPYKCKIMIGGNRCQSTSGTKSNIKNHYENIHTKDMYVLNELNESDKYENEDEYSDSVSDDDYESSSSCSTCDSSSSSSSLSSESSSNEDDEDTCTESEIEPDLLKELEIDSDHNTGSNQNETMDIDNDEEIDLFYKAHIFSMDCHFCMKVHFDDYQEYRDHIQEHYNEQPDKTWLVCDFGCYTSDKKRPKVPVASKNPGNFIAHIAMHLEEKPFKCNCIVNGSLCTKSTTTRGSLRNHWKNKHLKTKPKSSATKEFVESRLRAMKIRRSRNANGNKPNESRVILCSNLTSSQLENYEKFKTKFKNAATFVVQWQDNITHLITTTTIQKERILTARTIKYFQAIVSGTWVMCFDWIEKCLNEERLIDEMEYEVLGDGKAIGACKIARDLKQKHQNDKRLFADIMCIISSEFKINNLDQDLRDIFRMGGANVCNELPYEWLSDMDKYRIDTNGKTVIFVYDKEKTKMSSKQLEFVQKFGVLIVTYQQVFDAVSNYKSITNFITDDKVNC